MKSIPILDLGKIDLIENASENPNWISAAEILRDGLGAAGFLYLINHGIPDKVVAQAFEYSKRFYGMTTEDKLTCRKYTNNKDKLVDFYENYTGYTPLGVEVLNPNERQEMKEVYDWTDRATSGFPDKVLPEFKEKMLEMDMECKQLMKKLLVLMAMALKLDADYFLKHCQHLDKPFEVPGLHVGRLNYYPPISDDCKSTRCAEHTDYTFITLLFQDVVGGLQVKNADGEWINAEPLPGSIILNSGDLAEFWTSGVFPAIQHRVFIPPDNVKDEKRQKCRYSIAIFCGLDNATMITPMDLEKRSKEEKRILKDNKVFSKEPIGAYEYVMRRCANHSY